LAHLFLFDRAVSLAWGQKAYGTLSYSAKYHITPDPDSLDLLNASRKCHLQEIVGSLLNHARAVNNKLLIALSAIAARQAKATITTEQAVVLLLKCCYLSK
jgi:hypothetical protein